MAVTFHCHLPECLKAGTSIVKWLSSESIINQFHNASGQPSGTAPMVFTDSGGDHLGRGLSSAAQCYSSGARCTPLTELPVTIGNTDHMFILIESPMPMADRDIHPIGA